MPNVPTVAEGGLPGYEVEPWWGVLAPAATPQVVITKLHAALVEIVTSSVYKEKLMAQGADPISDTPAQFRAIIKAEFDKWGKVVKSAGMRIQ